MIPEGRAQHVVALQSVSGLVQIPLQVIDAEPAALAKRDIGDVVVHRFARFELPSIVPPRGS